MQFTSIKPYFFPDLIERIWVVENNSEEEKSIIIPPNQYTNICFPLSEQGYYYNRKHIQIAQIEGASFKPTYINYPSKTKVIGIRFYPTALYVFLDLSIKETINNSINCNSAIAMLPAKLNSKLEPNLLDHFYQYLQPQFSNKRYKQTSLIRNFYWSFRNSAEQMSIKSFIKQHNTNYSTLNRFSHKTLGSSTNQFIKLIKFRKSLCDLIDTNEKLTSISFNAGYFDQSHFIREFKLFMNCKPSDYNKHISSEKSNSIITNYNFRQLP